VTALPTIRAAAAGGDVIAQHLRTMAQLGAGEAVREAQRQGAHAAAPDMQAVEAELTARASALEQLLAQALSQAAANKAVQLSGGGMSPDEVAGEVADHLASLSDAYLSDQFGGALSAAQNAGRLAVMGANSPSRIYASELLDVNTCGPCRARDGHEYLSLDAAAVDYPAGGYRGCDGGPRCRGTVVAVYAEAPATEGAA
jgi:hypothetical protein